MLTHEARGKNRIEENLEGEDHLPEMKVRRKIEVFKTQETPSPYQKAQGSASERKEGKLGRGVVEGGELRGKLESQTRLKGGIPTSP